MTVVCGLNSLEVVTLAKNASDNYYPYTMAFQGYETQAYEVVDQLDAIEIRYYPPAMKVKVESSLKTATSMRCSAIFQATMHPIKKLP